MKILVTGDTGFLGSEIVNELSLIYPDVRGLSRNNSYYRFDLSSQIPVFDEAFDLVIHTAGVAHLGMNSFLSSHYNANVVGTMNLLDALTQGGVPKKFVYISSVSVYGASEGISISEDAPLMALDYYGKSKIESERLVLNWGINNNVVVSILRLPLIVGPNAPGNLGKMISGIKSGFYFNIIGSKSVKSMVLASCVVKSLINVSEIGGIYNLTDGHNHTFEDLSHHVARKLGVSNPKRLPLFIAKLLAILGDLVGDKFPINSNKLSKMLTSLTFDDSKARATFGWNPKNIMEGFII